MAELDEIGQVSESEELQGWYYIGNISDEGVITSFSLTVSTTGVTFYESGGGSLDEGAVGILRDYWYDDASEVEYGVYYTLSDVSLTHDYIGLYDQDDFLAETELYQWEDLIEEEEEGEDARGERTLLGSGRGSSTTTTYGGLTGTHLGGLLETPESLWMEWVMSNPDFKGLGP